MAFIQGDMDENAINFLANEIARTYMTGKIGADVEDFVHSYMNVYETAKKTIAKRENDKRVAMQNIDFIEEDVEEQSSLRAQFR